MVAVFLVSCVFVSEAHAYRSCKAILSAGASVGNGVYTIDPDDGGPLGSVDVYCEMGRDGGGWTLGLKAWYQAGVYGMTGAVGNVADGLTLKGNPYKLADDVIRAIIGPTENFDILADQKGYNSAYSAGNYEYVVVRNYTGAWRYSAGQPVAASSTPTVMQSYRASDNALAWTGALLCGAVGSAGAGINCLPIISNNPQGGAGCVINMGTASNAAWHHLYMGGTSSDTYLYVCNGAQHSSGHDMNHRFWFRETAMYEIADTTAPVINCEAADGTWHATDVSLSCTAEDAGSGLSNPVDAAFLLSTTTAPGVEWANAFTGSREVCDVAGNCATVGPIGDNMIDRKEPWVGITTPAAGNTITLGAVALADFSCQDAGSGLASCAGPVASGSAIDTATAGAKSFAVVGTDTVGNSTIASSTYTVGYRICLAYNPNTAHKRGSTVPLKIQLCDASSSNVSSSSVTVTALSVFFVSTLIDGVLEDSGNANPDSNFRYDSGQYIFNLSLKGFTTGTYGMRLKAGNDPTTHVIEFQVK